MTISPGFPGEACDHSPPRTAHTFQGVTESDLGGTDVAAEEFCSGHDAGTAGAQAGI